MNQLSDVKARARALVGDPDGDFCTDAYLTPLINQALDESVNYLEGSCSPFIESVIEAVNMPAGTTNFADVQKVGNKWAGLMNPLYLEAKQAGMPPTQYMQILRADKLPDVDPAQGVAPYARAYWEWRSWIIFITPLNYAADFRIRGEFRPSPLLKDSDIIPIHPLFAGALAYQTAALIGMERGNQGYVQSYGPRAESTLDDIAAELVRQQQGTSSRLGRMNGRSGLRR